MSRIYIGQRFAFGGVEVPHFFDSDALTRHVHVLGKTGMGKSTLLKTLIAGLIESGAGVGIIDPHGDLADWALRRVPEQRRDDVVFIDAADADFAPSLNLVSNSLPEPHRPRAASALLAAFRHIWAESWGPRLEHILYHALRTLFDCQNVSLVALPRLLTDETYRVSLVKQCRDPFIRSFWSAEFDSWDKRFRAEAIAPILNKLGQLVAIPALRESLGQMRLRVDFADILRSGRILIVSIPKGKLGDDASRLFGALITSSLSAAAMERASLREHECRNFTLVIDEAQNFLSDALASILSESRKFGLGLVLCHQFIDQAPPPLQAAILGNVGTTFAFRLSGEDAQRAALYFGNTSSAAFIELPPFTAMVRPLDGTGFPFRLTLSPLPHVPSPHVTELRAKSRMRHYARRDQVRERLHRWSQRMLE